MVAFAIPASVSAQTLDTFSVLGAQTVTNTGPTTLSGNLGLYPGTSVTGQASITLGGAYYINNAVAVNAQTALIGLIDSYETLTPTANLTGQDLGNMVLNAGVYKFDSSAQLTGTLTLDAEGDPNAVFIILVDSALTTASGSAVVLTNGAQGKNVYFVVDDATIGTGTAFAGKILAENSITLNTGATIDCGAAWAHNAAVTLDTNVITTFCAFSAFGDVLGPGSTTTAEAIAAALDAFVTAGGTLPTAFQTLLTLLAGLSPAEQAAILAQLSGEAGTGIAPAGTQAMDTFLSQVFDSAFADDRAPDTGPGPRVPGTVKTLSYADEGRPSGAGASYAALTGNNPSLGRSVWASAYGNHGTTTGDALVGSHDRFSSAFGVAAGYDYRTAPDVKIGLALGVGSTSFTLADNLGGGRSDMLQIAVYGRKTFGDAYLAAALAYAFNGVSTNRFAPIINETFTAEVGAHDFAAQVETGIHYGLMTPYVALRAQAFYTPAYRETSSVPASLSALAYDASTTFWLRSEIGARFATSVPLHKGANLGLHARVAWAHDFSSTPAIVASFQSMPGAPFTVQGAKAAGDALLLSAGADIALRNGFSIGGSFDGEFAQGAQSYGGKGRVRYTW